MRSPKLLKGRVRIIGDKLKDVVRKEGVYHHSNQGICCFHEGSHLFRRDFESVFEVKEEFSLERIQLVFPRNRDFFEEFNKLVVVLGVRSFIPARVEPKISHEVADLRGENFFQTCKSLERSFRVPG